MAAGWTWSPAGKAQGFTFDIVLSDGKAERARAGRGRDLGGGKSVVDELSPAVRLLLPLPPLF